MVDLIFKFVVFETSFFFPLVIEKDKEKRFSRYFNNSQESGFFFLTWSCLMGLQITIF